MPWTWDQWRFEFIYFQRRQFKCCNGLWSVHSPSIQFATQISSYILLVPWNCFVLNNIITMKSFKELFHILNLWFSLIQIRSFGHLQWLSRDTVYWTSAAWWDLIFPDLHYPCWSEHSMRSLVLLLLLMSLTSRYSISTGFSRTIFKLSSRTVVVPSELGKVINDLLLHSQITVYNINIWIYKQTNKQTYHLRFGTLLTFLVGFVFLLLLVTYQLCIEKISMTE